MFRSRLLSTALTALLALILCAGVAAPVVAKRDHKKEPPGHARKEQKAQRAHDKTSPSPAPAEESEHGNDKTDNGGSDAALQIASRSDPFLAQVGEIVNYSVTVTNVGSDDLAGVTVTDSVPTEVGVLRAPGASSRDSGSIVWELNKLAAGASAELAWTGSVTKAGDLVAVNLVTANATGAARAAAENKLYLALASSPSVTDPGRDTVRRKIVRYVEPAAVGSAGATAAGGAVLPVTGGDPSPWIIVALTLLGLGTVLAVSRTKSAVKAGVVLVLSFGLIATACVDGSEPSSDNAQSRSDDSDKKKEKDEVLGKRVDRDDVDGGKDEAEKEAAGPTEDAEETDVLPVEPPAPAEPVRVVETVEVDSADLPITDQPSRPGDNVVSYEWDDDAGSITQATSGRRFSKASLVEILANVSDQDGSLVTAVSLTNLDADHRLRVEGVFELEIMSSGSSTTLTSDPVSVVLDPNGTVTAEFVYRLPSGSYSNGVTFRAN